MKKPDHLDRHIETDRYEGREADKPTPPGSQSSHNHILIISNITLIWTMDRITDAVAESTDESSNYLEKEYSFEVTVEMHLQLWYLSTLRSWVKEYFSLVASVNTETYCPFVYFEWAASKNHIGVFDHEFFLY